MSTHTTRDYRRDLAAIHDHVVRTGTPAVVTRDGVAHVKVVPARERQVLERLQELGRISLPGGPRRPVEPVDAGGDDTTTLIADTRR